MNDKLAFTVQKTFPLQSGGTVKVTIGSDQPINESDYLLLRPQAAIEMAECFIDLARAMKGPKK